jgi:hypothetical protein
MIGGEVWLWGIFVLAVLTLIVRFLVRRRRERVNRGRAERSFRDYVGRR